MLNQCTLTRNLGRDPVTMQRAGELIGWQSDEFIWDLYSRYEDNPKVKWKDSIKNLVGLEIPIEAGLDL